MKLLVNRSRDRKTNQLQSARHVLSHSRGLSGTRVTKTDTGSARLHHHLQHNVIDVQQPKAGLQTNIKNTEHKHTESTKNKYNIIASSYLLS